MSLSDKINESAMSMIDGDFVLMVRDVKEFINDLIDKGEPITIDEIKELAGDKLIK